MTRRLGRSAKIFTTRAKKIREKTASERVSRKRHSKRTEKSESSLRRENLPGPRSPRIKVDAEVRGDRCRGASEERCRRVREHEGLAGGIGERAFLRTRQMWLCARAGAGGRSRAEPSVRLPLSPRTLCAPGAGAGPPHGAHAHAPAQAQGQGQSQAHAHGQSAQAEDSAGLPEEPIVHLERAGQQGTWICCVPCYWLRRSKAVHKALLTFAMLLVTSLLVTSPVLFLITTLPEGEQPRSCAPLDEACIRERDGPEGVCDSKACEEAAGSMLAFMKRSVDPCKDFYQFACGGFRDQQPYQPSSSFNMLQAQVEDHIHRMLKNETGRMIGAFEKLGQFYSVCQEFKEKPVDFASVYELLDDLGGYLPPKSAVPVDITPLVSALLRVNGAPLFDFYVDVDLYDRSRSSVFLDLPIKYRGDTLFMDDLNDEPGWRKTQSRAGSRRKRSLHEESQAYTVIKTKREELRSQRIQKIAQGLLPKNMDPKERASETDLLLQFCLSLGKIYPKHKDLYNWVDVDQRVYVPYNMSYLQESFGYIRWGTLLNATLGAATADLYSHSRTKARTSFAHDDQLVHVYVTAPRYFRSLGKLLNHFPKRTIHNGLLLLYAADTLYDIVNVTASRDWSLSCFKLTKDIFSEIVGALYVQQYTPENLETLANRVAGLFERVKETVAERILVKSWLDEETRTQALLKLNSLRGRFHVWPGFHNETLLNREMAEVAIDPDDFIATVVKRFRQIRTVDDKVLRRNVTEKRRHPYSVNAYYESSTNTIGIPLAMMRSWAWSWDGGPAYTAHATLGSVIGHEILHAFDLHRRRLPLDPDLNVDQWLWITPESWKRLEARIECVARLYARSFWRKVQFYGNDVAVQFDWNVTRNENVADIGALQISYKTWHTLTNGKDRSLPGLEGLRPSQLFFISAAQTYCSNMTAEAYILSVELDFHTPQPERVNGIMMNSQAFADAFRCPIGTKMNPPNKCTTCEALDDKTVYFEERTSERYARLNQTRKIVEWWAEEWNDRRPVEAVRECAAGKDHRGWRHEIINSSLKEA
ncbi:hypothetical protein KM043_000641 [Ampulex compressa]|nr:hypothetical protein KM043_000641 [Ampulex compressa]